MHRISYFFAVFGQNQPLTFSDYCDKIYSQRSKIVKNKTRGKKMKSSDIITEFIMQLLNESNGETEIKRNELAQQFNVVPSQINYVITSRFTPELGFMTESRRGGGGYIRIKRVYSSRPEVLMHVINCIGSEISAFDGSVIIDNLASNDYISDYDYKLLSSILPDRLYQATAPRNKDVIRAAILKSMLLAIASNG